MSAGAPVPATNEAELDPEVATATGLRTGWTTGTCASAAAKAATSWLVHGVAPDEVEVALPSGRRVRFEVADIDPAQPYRCAVVKDAGDDPDCTDGAHVTAHVAWRDGDGDGVGAPSTELDGVGAPSTELDGVGTPSTELDGVGTPSTELDGVGALGQERVELAGGEGVGVVTLPGLGLAVGAPAINPVPARMIRAAIAEVTDRAVRCTISVPGGQAMAERTSNDRLGIVGGISILGTTGVVRPFSTASYRASVVQQLDVAAAQQAGTVVLSTGSRSDAAAQRLWPELAPVCFVEVGDFTGIALRRAAALGLASVHFVGMAGKIAKLAAGEMMTHFRRSKVDSALLAEVAAEVGASAPVRAAATATATARHFAEVCVAAGELGPLAALCGRAARACEAHAASEGRPALRVDVTMIDFEGREVLAHG